MTIVIGWIENVGYNKFRVVSKYLCNKKKVLFEGTEADCKYYSKYRYNEKKLKARGMW